MEEGAGAALKEAEEKLDELREKTDRVEDDLRRSARRAAARDELAEARHKLEDMEADLEALKSSGREAAGEFKAGFKKKQDELEILLNRAASDMG